MLKLNLLLSTRAQLHPNPIPRRHSYADLVRRFSISHIISRRFTRPQIHVPLQLLRLWGWCPLEVECLQDSDDQVRHCR
jgi:hypothetical protein